MLLSTKLLNLLAVAVIVVYRSEVIAVSGEADVDSSLKQALFLVELLKSDFAKVLRENSNLKNGVVANSSEDNSTCPTPIEDSNSTTEGNLTESGASSATEVWTATSTVPANLGMRPEGPRLPFSSWPPMPIPGYPIPGPDQQRNFPADENYRFPYRFGRRRMMPDYYYYDSPMQSRGKFRRVNRPDPITEDLPNATATTQAQTTPYLPSTTSDVPTLHVEETTTSTSTLSSNMTQPSTSAQQTAQSSTQPTIQSPTQPTIHSLTPPSTQLSTKPIQTKYGVRTPASILKAYSAIISNRHEKLKLNSVGEKHLRRRKTTTEKITSEDVVMSQVASELSKEFKGTKSENIPDIFNQDKKGSKLNSKKKTSTTMKIYLKGSSRLPVPLPENNAFCYSYPHNALCGSML